MLLQHFTSKCLSPKHFLPQSTFHISSVLLGYPFFDFLEIILLLVKNGKAKMRPFYNPSTSNQTYI